jgi:hypothetical protein
MPVTERERLRIAKAAGMLLKEVAMRDGLLLSTLQEFQLTQDGLPHAVPAQELGFDNTQDLLKHLKEKVPAEMLTRVESSTGVSLDIVVRPVVEQLRRVAQFVASDGGATLENVRAVEQLIRSGRVEMFAH